MAHDEFGTANKFNPATATAQAEGAAVNGSNYGVSRQLVEHDPIIKTTADAERAVATIADSAAEVPSGKVLVTNAKRDILLSRAGAAEGAPGKRSVPMTISEALELVSQKPDIQVMHRSGSTDYMMGTTTSGEQDDTVKTLQDAGFTVRLDDARPFGFPGTGEEVILVDSTQPQFTQKLAFALRNLDPMLSGTTLQDNDVDMVDSIITLNRQLQAEQLADKFMPDSPATDSVAKALEKVTGGKVRRFDAGHSHGYTEYTITMPANQAPFTEDAGLEASGPNNGATAETQWYVVNANQPDFAKKLAAAVVKKHSGIETTKMDGGYLAESFQRVLDSYSRKAGVGMQA
jgi:hypothetical protein